MGGESIARIITHVWIGPDCRNAQKRVCFDGPLLTALTKAIFFDVLWALRPLLDFNDQIFFSELRVPLAGYAFPNCTAPIHFCVVAEGLILVVTEQKFIFELFSNIASIFYILISKK